VVSGPLKMYGLFHESNMFYVNISFCQFPCHKDNKFEVDERMKIIVAALERC
jgi:hypothetical protein